MAVDYTPVSGFAIKFPDGVIARLVNDNNADHFNDLLEDKDIDYETVGSAFTGDTYSVIVLQPKPENVDKQISKWLNMVNRKLKLDLTLENVYFISDLYIW